MDYLVPDEAAAGPFGQALVASDCIHWGPSVTQGPCQVLCLHSLGRGRKTEHQAPSPTVRRWGSWDLMKAACLQSPGMQVPGLFRSSHIEMIFSFLFTIVSSMPCSRPQ